MLKRLISSMPNNKKCIDCKLHIYKNNKLNANITNDKICRHLDKTNLINSITSEKYSNISGLFTMVSLPFALYDYRILCVSFTSFIISSIFSDISRDFKEKYLDDNNINDTS